MATKKKLLEAAAGAASGAAGLNVESVFSTYLYEGNGSAQNINNGINLGDNIAGSVDFDGTGDSLKVTGSSFDYSGDLTVEFWVKFDTLGGTAQNIFDARASSGVANSFMIGVNSSNKMRLYAQNLSNYIEETNAPSTGVWYHYAVVRSSGTWTMYRDGTSTGTPVSSDTNDYSSGTISIGQRSFTDGLELDGKLSNLRVVTGTAVYTANFTAPTEPLTNITNTAVLICTENNLEDEGPDKIAFTVKGDPTPSSESPFSGNTGEGGLVWVKERTALSTGNHELMDTERGTSVVIFSDLTNGNFSKTNGLTSFNSNGFSIGSNGGWNNNTSDYASWTFRKAPKFFDVVTYTGTGVARTVSHNLGSVPGMIIVKRTDSATSWNVYHRGLNGGTNPHQYGINLNTTGAEFASSGYWNNTAPTSTEFTVGTSGNANASGGSYVAYLFAHNDGDGDFGPTGDQDIIKCGSFTTDGSGAASVDLGWEAQFVIWKKTNAAENWNLFDSMRGSKGQLKPNTSDAESTSFEFFRPTATGFDTVNLSSSAPYIYIAIRRGPMAVPTAGTDVFATAFDAGATDPTYVSGFVTDMGIQTNTGGYNKRVSSRLTFGRFVEADNIGAESTSTSNYTWDFMNGWNNQTINSTWLSWMWKRAPSFFDVVAYTGTGSSQSINHNLGVAPEMMWVKNRSSAANWSVYHKDLPSSGILRLNQNAANQTGDGVYIFGNDSTLIAPTDTIFTVGGADGTSNTSGSSYIIYLFASVDGVSKVGSYTGTGSPQTIDCGFSSGARFVLIKRSDSTGDWLVFDTERGIVVGNDPFLELNTTDAENNSFDMIRPDSSGFIAYNNSVNGSGGTYIFYAIA